MKSIAEMMDLEGRVALITGGAGNIGKEMAEALAELNSEIVILDIDYKKCSDVAESIKLDYGVETLAIDLDLLDEERIKDIPDQISDFFGSLDILINNAALVGTSDLKGWAVPFRDQLHDTWKLALNINLTAPFILTQICTPLLAKSGHGSIINIASIYGIVGPNMSIYEGSDMFNPAAYASSKGGLIQLTRWLATMLAPDVRVNAITPGGVLRNQPDLFIEKYESLTPLKRMATEEDFKGAVAYLASDMSSYVTGHNLIVDGGWTVW